MASVTRKCLYALPGNSTLANQIFYVGAEVKSGDTTLHLSTTLPKDIDGGSYQAIDAFLSPCPGYQKQKPVEIPHAALLIRPVQDTNQYPTKADLKLSSTSNSFSIRRSSSSMTYPEELTREFRGARWIAFIARFLIRNRAARTGAAADHKDRIFSAGIEGQWKRSCIFYGF